MAGGTPALPQAAGTWKATMRHAIFVSLLWLGVTTASLGQLTAAEQAAVLINHNYNVKPNITYLVANNYEAKLDVYYPRESKAPVPVVVSIHGGGWVAGYKEETALEALPYLQMGFAVVNVEYRLAKVSLAPAAVEDCLCAMHWLGRNAKEYNLDLNKVVVTGGSAGGHLALTTSMIPFSAGFENQCAVDDDETWAGAWTDRRPKVAAVINWFGITDVADMLHGPNLHSYAVSWLGSLPNREVLARQLSPINYVRADSPPVFTVHGDHDLLVPYQHAVRLHEALTKAGVKNQLFTIPGGGHGGFTAEQELKAFEAIKAFLASVGIRPVVR